MNKNYFDNIRFAYLKPLIDISKQYSRFKIRFKYIGHKNKKLSINMSLPPIQVFGKPIEKLIETVSKGIGSLYKPKAIRKEADAKAYELIVLAQAKSKAAIIKSDTDNEILERAKQRIVHQEMNRQINLENIADMAAEQLNETVSDQPIDNEWRTRFFNKAQDITSDELQIIWAKILANEINKPGHFSLRTLDILSNLSKHEAEAFSKLSSISTREGCIFNFADIQFNNIFNTGEFDIKYDDLLLLRAAGLLHDADTLSISAEPIHALKHFVNNEFIEEEMGNNFVYKDSFVWIGKNNQPLNLRCYLLTKSGIELWQILNNGDNEAYLNYLQNSFSTNGYKVNIIPLPAISGNPNNEMSS